MSNMTLNNVCSDTQTKSAKLSGNHKSVKCKVLVECIKAKRADFNLLWTIVEILSKSTITQKAP
jgi:hypothetical protein